MKLEEHERYEKSEIEWLGEIPAHWEVRRIKEVFKNFGSGATPRSGDSTFYEDGEIHWLNTTDLNNGHITDTKNKITASALKASSLKIYPVNSLAIAMYGQGKTRGMVGLFKRPVIF